MNIFLINHYACSPKMGDQLSITLASHSHILTNIVIVSCKRWYQKINSYFKSQYDKFIKYKDVVKKLADVI